MLSREDNELLCRIGPGTPMGTLMRQYWVPAALSSELPDPDGAPLRVRLLGVERLRGYRADLPGRRTFQWPSDVAPAGSDALAYMGAAGTIVVTRPVVTS